MIVGQHASALPAERKERLRIYVCSVCGYDYDEAAGDPKSGITPGTRFEDLPEDWVCPVCGADKSMFALQGGEEQKQSPAPPRASRPRSEGAENAKLQAVMAANLARGAGKQYRDSMSQLFTQVSEFFEQRSQPEGDLQGMASLLQQDLDTAYPAAFDAAREARDRGALRALTWGEKVSRIQLNLISRYLKEGDSLLDKGKVFVCDACGFIFIGGEAPEICPVCKVPRFKFNLIEKEASA